MPVDTFHREFIELIDSRRWDRKSAQEVDRDMTFMIFTCLEIYMSGRKPSPPRPLRDAIELGRRPPPPPEPDNPGVLFGAFSVCTAHRAPTRRRRTYSRR